MAGRPAVKLDFHTINATETAINFANLILLGNVIYLCLLHKRPFNITATCNVY